MASTPKYLRPYHLAAQAHGADFRTTLWNSRASQRIRFEVMAESFEFAGRRVLDAGCGMGDLLAFLEETGHAPARYVGVDALAQIVDGARRQVRHFATPAEFHIGDLVVQPELFGLGEPEVVAISGTLNTLGEPEFFAMLDRAFAAPTVALAFNFLSTRHAPFHARATSTIVRMDPAKVFDHGLSLTRKIIVRHDYYDGHDCTMVWEK
ncbi:MAG: class I SAM-dependent methyltransferase [Phycisphaerae bacterium]|nr:class I SAM-dependent methyltransferase [Phycisphaerae bacterium]